MKKNFKSSKKKMLTYCIESPEAALISPQALPLESRPREKLSRKGRESLSDRELLAVILNTGVKGKNVSKLSGELLNFLDLSKTIPTVDEICTIKGMGAAKASVIVSMLEFCHRRWGRRNTKIKNPGEIFDLIHHLADPQQERFIVLSFNSAHELLALRTVTVGLIDKTIVHPREVFADVICDRASALCVAHNHPSGNLTPSLEDDEVTIRLQMAADVLGIQLLDHIIFSNTDYYSYREKNRLSFD